MCQICVDFELNKLTLSEAYNNLREVYNESDGHSIEVWLKLIKAEKDKE